MLVSSPGRARLHLPKSLADAQVRRQSTPVQPPLHRERLAQAGIRIQAAASGNRRQLRETLRGGCGLGHDGCADAFVIEAEESLRAA